MLGFGEIYKILVFKYLGEVGGWGRSCGYLKYCLIYLINIFGILLCKFIWFKILVYDLLC